MSRRPDDDGKKPEFTTTDSNESVIAIPEFPVFNDSKKLMIA